jgi:glucose/arabinose dehydrogenase
MGDDQQDDALNRPPRDGLHFGFPHCHQGNIVDPKAGGRRCMEFVAPELLPGLHVAAPGMRFYRGAQLPREYRGNVFIALHGSWSRTEKRGIEVDGACSEAFGRS